MADDLLNATSAARYLAVSRQRIYELAQAGRLGHRLAGYWVFSRAELDAYRQARHGTKGGRPKQVMPVPQTPSATQLQQLKHHLAAALEYALVQAYPGGGFVGESLDYPGVTAFGPTRVACADALRARLLQAILTRLQAGDELTAIIDSPAPRV